MLTLMTLLPALVVLADIFGLLVDSGADLGDPAAKGRGRREDPPDGVSTGEAIGRLAGLALALMAIGTA